MKNIISLFAVAILLSSFIVYAVDTETITETELQIINQTFSDPGITPDNFMYIFKRWGEGFQKFFTFDKIEKAKLNLKFAKLRLTEAKIMTERNQLQYIKNLIEEYNRELDEADKNIPIGQNISEIVRQANLTLPKSEIILEFIYTKAPEAAKHGLERAINNSIEKRIRWEEKIRARTNETEKEFEERTREIIRKRILENIEIHKERITNIAEIRTELMERALEKLDELIEDAQEKNQTERLKVYESIQKRLESKIEKLENNTRERIQKLTQLQRKIRERSKNMSEIYENETD